jgi:UrcA family protein
VVKNPGHKKRKFIMATPKLFSYVLLAASALAISAPVMAMPKSKEVRYADLNLASDDGQQRFMTRVKSAVKKVCANPRAFTLKDRADLQRCEKEATAQAMPKAERAIAAYVENSRLAARTDKAVVGN